jgi:hypothetical protein
MKLADLKPQFLRYERRHDGVFYIHVETIAEAHGVRFLCPKCFAENGSAVGTHGVIVWFAGRGVPDDAEPGAAYAPGQSAGYPQGRAAQRWTVSGSTFNDLTTKPSIALRGRCAWHGFVTNGDAA